MLSFENDYSQGAHEKILQRLIETNMDAQTGYGFDEYTESAKARIIEACGCADAEIHFLVGCPPVVAPCFYGVAMATKKELIAANYSIEEIKEQLDIDTLGYITLDALIDAIGMPAEDLCLGCLNEEYPTELPDDIEAETYYKP